jgi:hypothetical protein
LQSGNAIVRVKPQLGPLARVNAAVPTPHGPVELTAEQPRPGRFRLALALPPTLATHLVGLPVANAQKMVTIRVNGQVVWAKGKPAAKLREKSQFSPRFEDGYAWLELPGGQWALEVRE